MEKWVALMIFGKKNHWFKQIMSCKFADFKPIGKVRSVEVRLLVIPYSEFDFTMLSLEKQRQIFFTLLKKAKREGAAFAGMPDVWREFLGRKTPLKIIDARPFMLSELVKELTSMEGSLKGKDMAIFGLNDKATSFIPEYFFDSGANLLLCGREAKNFSEKFYRDYGWALPALSKKKAIFAAQIFLAVSEEAAVGLPENAYILREKAVFVDGDWLPKTPYSNGYFPSGLAAAILAIPDVKPMQREACA